MIEAVGNYTFPLDEYSICILGVRLRELANRLGLPVREWVEDGLGSAAGVAVRTPIGHVFVLIELDHAVRHLGSPGPSVLVDVGEVADHGPGVLVAELLQALALTREDAAWIHPETAQEMARERAEWVRTHPTSTRT